MPNQTRSSGVTVGLPSGWEDRTMMTLVGPRGSKGFAANVVLTREPLAPAKSLPEYAARQLTAMKAELPALTVLDERPITHQGAPGFQRLHRFTADQDVVQQAQTFVLARGTVYVLTCSAQLQDFDANLSAFRAISDSLKIDDAD